MLRLLCVWKYLRTYGISRSVVNPEATYLKYISRFHSPSSACCRIFIKMGHDSLLWHPLLFTIQTNAVWRISLETGLKKGKKQAVWQTRQAANE